MPIEKTANTYKDFNALNGGFKGLFNSMNSHMIPDGYLAAMENLEVDEYGVLHAVQPPDPAAGSAERKIMYCGCPVWQDYSVANDITGTKVTDAESLATADGSFNPDADVFTAGSGYDWTVYLDRFYFNYGNVLRYSGVSKLTEGVTWIGRNAYNFQVYPYTIEHLQPMQSGLYVIGDGVITRMTEPNVGSISEVYYGPRTPISDGVQSYVLNNGSSIVYCSTGGIYHFGGAGDPQRIDAPIHHIRSIAQFFAAEYYNRVWVFVQYIDSPSKIFAMNKSTGYWEQYEPTTIVPGGANTITKLGWPRTQSTLTLDLKGGTWFQFSKLAADTGVRMPWTFTTKDFTPSFDAYTRAVHAKFFYLGQTGVSTVATIQIYADGALIDTVTQEMLGSGLQHKDYDVAATLANSFHLVVTGTGKADIIDTGIEFTVRHKGQPDL
jgi:hypothetical protein